MSVKLINGDCFSILGKFNSSCIDCVICDPPYNIGIDEWDKDFDLSFLVSQIFRITKDCSNVIIFQGWSNVCGTIEAFNKYFTLKDWIIWDRVKGRGGTKSLVSTREDILWFVKDSDNYTFNKVSSSIKKLTGGMGLKNGNEFRALSNVWIDVSPIVPWSKERVEHPTQKPVQLMERCVSLWSNPNDVVLDFTMGSGSTGVACKNLNRNFVGIEINKDYYDIAQSRIGV